jgi:hypothetical protein
MPGLTDPVGKYILQPKRSATISKLKIIGIMKDFNIESMHKPYLYVLQFFIWRR